jgi:predicted DNA-binding transcriptional regulator YafY
LRADRLVSIILLLQTRGHLAARELAGNLEVSERTIYRDLDALSAAGVPVYVNRGRNGGCALVDGYRTDLTGLTGAEAQALFTGRGDDYLSDLGLAQVGAAALEKLLAALPDLHRGAAYEALARIHIDPDVWFHTPETVPFLPLVHEAVR